jgi:serralysin
MSLLTTFGHDDRNSPLSDHTSGARDWNGDGATTAAVALSGNALIDGILRLVRWGGSITYSAPDSLADYQAGYFSGSPGLGVPAFNTTDFSAFTPAQMIAMHFALNASTYTQPAAAPGFSVEGFTGLSITFNGLGVGTGTIRGANMDDANPTAYAFYPYNSVYGGDTFFGDNYDGTSNSYKTPMAGNYAWHTMIHELGHSLGLKHGHQGAAAYLTTPANPAVLPAAQDSVEFSVMTYRSYIGDATSGYDYGAWDAPQTFMMADIAALQYMYGADFSTNSGNTTYRWTAATGDTRVNGAIAINAGGAKIFATIWDGGGVDTYDLSAYTTSLKINLAPGGFSVFATAQLASLGGGPNGGLARGNIFNALQFGSDARSLIENAIGGSAGDNIRGNAAQNELNGKSGNDILQGYDGQDILIGGLGKDTMTGGNQNDTFLYTSKTHSAVGVLADVIKDFDDFGNDRIDLSALFIAPMVYRHALAFTANGQVRINDVAGVDVVVEVNISGTLAADFSIRLTNTTLASMTAGDFVL